MRFNPETRILRTNKGELIKEMHCPLQKRWDEMTPIGSDDRARLCGGCGKSVHSTDGLTDVEVLRLMRKNSEACLMVRLDSPNLTIEGQPSVRGMAALEESCPMRRIRTARGMRAINEMASATLRPLVVPVRPGSTSRFAVWQHRQTGQIELQGDMRWSPNSECEGEPQWEQVIGRYAYEFGPRCGDDGIPVAAYMIPADLRPGERVWVEDIIESVEAGRNISQGGTWYHDSAAAIWTGERFVFQVPEPGEAIG